MSEETHKWLINFESKDTSATTGVDALLAKLAQLREAISTTGADWDKLMTRGGDVTPAGGVTPATSVTTVATSIPAAQGPVYNVPLEYVPAPISTSVPLSKGGVPLSPGTMSPEVQAQIADALLSLESMTTALGAVPPAADAAGTGLARLSKRYYDVGEMIDIVAAKQRQLLEEMRLAGTQYQAVPYYGGARPGVPFTTAEQYAREQQAPTYTGQYYEGPATTAEQKITPQVATRYYEMSQAMKYYTDETRVATTVQDEFGESVQRSGNWLMNYIERYLIKYFVVWQGIVAIKTTIRDWIQAHEDLDIAMFRLQTTMGMTTDQAERYMGTMRQIGGGIGISAAQLAGGAMQLGPTGAGMAGQFGAMTGQGAAQGMQFFAGIQRQYELTNAEIEQLIPRMFAAFARSGQDIQTFLKSWQEMLAQFDAGSGAVSEWTRALGIYETMGMHATQRVSSAWNDFLSVLGDTKPITDAKNAIADFFGDLAKDISHQRSTRFQSITRDEQEAIYARYRAETGQHMYSMIISESFRGWEQTPEFRKWWAQQPEYTGLKQPATTGTYPDVEARRATGWSPGEAVMQSLFGIKGFGGKMTAGEAEKYEDLVQKWDAYFLEQGRHLEKQTITLVTEIGQPLKEIRGSAEASRMALEEMNERQKSAVYNWPGGAPLIIMPQALDQVSTTTRGGGGGSTGGGGGGGESAGGGGGSTWQPQPIDWNNPWVIPPQYRVPNMGHVGQAPNEVANNAYAAGAQAAAKIIQGSNWLPTTIKTQVALDGKKVGESTNQVLGDSYNQAARAIYGGGGGLVSP